jgi:23S rRNA pseudouridine1911/1915/1917 synthase
VVETIPTQTILTVDRSCPTERFDAWLCARLAPLSRGAVQRLIREGHIQIDGHPIKPSLSPKAGQRVEIHWPTARPPTAEPEPIPLRILFEDQDLLVLDKPPGMVTHPSAGHERGTLVHALLHHCQGGLSGIGGVARPGIVHRLDRDTSGCMVVAKNDRTHLALSAQFESRQVQKLYHALLCGTLNAGQGEIRAAIARHPTHRKRMAVTDGTGRDAWTSYRVLERFAQATLVEATLHTGRTHQIRVHFKHLGFPLVGDATYGKRQNQRLAQVIEFAAARHMLHAFRLSFQHPLRSQRLVFEAAWPPDFAEAVGAVRACTTPSSPAP